MAANVVPKPEVVSRTFSGVPCATVELTSKHCSSGVHQSQLDVY